MQATKDGWKATSLDVHTPVKLGDRLIGVVLDDPVRRLVEDVVETTSFEVFYRPRRIAESNHCPQRDRRFVCPSVVLRP